MESILTAKYMQDVIDITGIMWRNGWDERNGGNISYLLKEEDVAPYLDTAIVKRQIPFIGIPENLRGCMFLVTATGSYFKNIEKYPEENLGIVRLAQDGDYVDVLWGFGDHSAPTSEFPTHLLSHSVRIKQDPNHRVILHNHATNISAMTFVHPLDEDKLTRTLWGIITECLIVFPDGVGLLPWMVCGNQLIGEETAKKMESRRIVVWAHHGILAAGTSIDDAFGLIETVEKAAQIYMLMYKNQISEITDEQLLSLAEAFHVVPRAGILCK